MSVNRGLSSWASLPGYDVHKFELAVRFISDDSPGRRLYKDQLDAKGGAVLTPSAASLVHKARHQEETIRKRFTYCTVARGYQ